MQFKFLQAIIVSFFILGQALALKLPSALVATDFVQDNLNNEALLLLDIRKTAAYEAGHIQGAINSPYGPWRVSRDGVVGLLPDKDYVQGLIQKAGIDKNKAVVVIFANGKGSDFGSAARVYWTLKTAGLSNIAILNGGLKAWQQKGLKLYTTSVKPSPSNYKITQFNEQYLVNIQAVQAASLDKKKLLLDARPKNQYEGYAKHPKSKVGGTIGDAKNFSQFEVFDKQGQILDKAKLQAKLADFKLDSQEEIISFCNTGHWAATNWFVLSEVLQKDKVKLYDGSMVEWTSQKGLQTSNSKNRLQLWLHDISN